MGQHDSWPLAETRPGGSPASAATRWCRVPRAAASSGQGKSTAWSSLTGSGCSRIRKLGASSACSRWKNGCSHRHPGPPWSWLPGITATGTRIVPMAAQTAETSGFVARGESNRSPCDDNELRGVFAGRLANPVQDCKAFLLYTHGVLRHPRYRRRACRSASRRYGESGHSYRKAMGEGINPSILITNRPQYKWPIAHVNAFGIRG